MTPQCRHDFQWIDYCGCHVCSICEQHAHVRAIGGQVIQLLERCWCGWSKTRPGRGRDELHAMGETIGDEGQVGDWSGGLDDLETPNYDAVIETNEPERRYPEDY